MDLLQHRSVTIRSIQKITEIIIANPGAAKSYPKGKNEPSPLDKLWNFVKSESGIISSNAVNKLVELVQKGIVNWIDALNGLTDALSTLSGISLDNAIIGITEILSNQACIGEYYFNHGRHPFIIAMTIKPEQTCTILLSQLEKIFDISRIRFVEPNTPQKKSVYIENLLNMMKPFFDHILLDGMKENLEFQKYWSSVLMQFLIHLIYQDADDEFYWTFKEHLLEYLLSVVQRVPLTPIFTNSTKNFITSNSIYILIQSLVQIVGVNFIQNGLNETFLQKFNNTLGTQILALACDAQHANLSTNHYISLFYKISIPQGSLNHLSQSSFILIWPTFSFLLLDTQSSDNQLMILEIMQKLIELKLKNINDCDVPPPLVGVAILPLFQVISDVEKSTTRNTAMEILLMVQKFQTLQYTPLEFNEQISILLKLPCITGTIALILSEINCLLNSYSSPSSYEFKNLDSYFSTLFYVPYLFHHDVATRILALDYLISIINSDFALIQTQKFPIFLLILYVLRNDGDTLIHLHILHHALPSLISTTDPTITAKILKITMGLVQGQEIKKETNLNAVGIRMLYKLWLRQRRCWKQLRFILSEWTKERKLETSAYDDTKRERFEIELAALSTIRDICKSKGRDYAEELLPFISSLLQSVILHPKSLYLVIEALNACVEAKVVETRAVWIVLMSYIADAIMQTDPLNIHLISKLCEFYKLIVQHDDDTVAYNEFKQNILESNLCPLIFPQKILYTSETDQEVLIDDSIVFKIQQNFMILKHGLITISQFNATDILSIFPVSSETLLSQIFNSNERSWNLSQVEEWQFVLSKIISHEVYNMRRNLLRGVSVEASSGGKSATSKSDNTNVFQSRKEKIESIATKIVNEWEIGLVSPGLRAGYALASLICFNSQMDNSNKSRSQTLSEIKDLKTTRFYKLMANAIQDINLTDHWVIRLGIVANWCNFFEKGLRELSYTTSESEDEIIKVLIEDLMKRLDDARFPYTCQNIILALIGLCLSLKSLNVSSTQQYATTTLRYLSTLTIMNEKLVQEVVDTLVTKLSEDKTSTTGWALFGAGYSLGTLLSYLASFPMKTSLMSNICSQTVSFLYDLISSTSLDNLGPTNLYLGIMIGLSNVDCDDEPETERIYQMALSDLKKFVENNGKIDENIKSRIAGSAWFVSFSRGKGLNEEIIEILEKATKISGARKEMSEYHFHFSQSYSHVLQDILQVKQSSHNLSSFNANVNSCTHTLTTAGTSSSKRHTALITIGSLAGVDYFSLPYHARNRNFYFFSSASSAIVTQVLDILQNVAELGSQASSLEMTMSDVKGGRLAVIILGQLMQVIERISEDTAMLVGDSARSITSSTEPKDYSRLPASSYLKSLFDRLVWISLESSPPDSSIEAASLIISTFSKISTILPPVNWFPLFVRFNEPAFMKFNLKYLIVTMAIQHCSRSVSLMEFLVHILIEFPNIYSDNNIDIKFKTFLICEGLGKILELCGFEKTTQTIKETDDKQSTQMRGVESIAKKVVVPNSRVIDIVDKMTSCLFGNSINPENEQELIKLLKVVYYKLSIPLTENQAQIIRLATQSCIFFIEDTNDDNLIKSTITICAMSELGRIDVTKHLARILQNCLTTFNDKIHIETLPYSLPFAWIHRAIYVNIHGNNKSENSKRKICLEWLVRILDVLIVLATPRQKKQLQFEEDILECGVKIALSGLVNLCWKKSSNILTNSFMFTNYEAWNEKFLKVVQDVVSVRKLSILIPKEFTSNEESIDIVQKQIIKRLLKLLELSKEMTSKGRESYFIFYSILIRLKVFISDDNYRALLIGDIHCSDM
ncbi:12564_t:CDS:10 [Dentiscutata erythropus]|uniref:12564_t:CDS:1 n=1 Tax=Dentiscutata erythropus TaxID=1348616 RepID=A0A9N8VKW0_9GLOM|nr:12564_t:CDS:10 [Dentiscutata erythropus]